MKNHRGKYLNSNKDTYVLCIIQYIQNSHGEKDVTKKGKYNQR